MNVDAERSGRAGSTARSDRDILANAHLSTEEGIYGLILVAGLVAVAGNAGLTSPQTLLFVLVTNSVFWTAHVYSGAVAAHSGSEALPLGRATPRPVSGRGARRFTPSSPFGRSPTGATDHRTRLPADHTVGCRRTIRDPGRSVPRVRTRPPALRGRNEA